MAGRRGGSHNRPGRGNIQTLVNAKGYVTLRGRVNRDGRTHYAQAVGVGIRARYTQKAWGYLERQAREQAQAYLDVLVSELDAGRVPDLRKRLITLNDWLDVWSVAKQDALSAETTTWQRYETSLRVQVRPYLGEARIATIGQAKILRWRRELRDHPERPQSAKNVREAERLLRETLRDAAGQGYPVDEGVFKLRPLADPGKGTRELARALGPDDFLALLAASPEPNQTAWLVCYHMAGRAGEMRGLKWGRILWSQRQIDVSRQLDREDHDRLPKWNSTGRVDVPKELLDALLSHRRRQEAAGVGVGEGDYVFFDARRGEVPSYWCWRYWLKEDLRRAGLPDVGGLHILRHGAGRVMAEVEPNPLNIKRRMRHANLRATERYVEAPDDAGRKTASKVARRLNRSRIG